MSKISSFNTQLADAFATVIDLPPKERQTFLRRLGADDPALRQALDSLLTTDAAISAGNAEDPLIGPVAAERAAFDPAIFPGFRVLRPLGSGTAGTVYEAQQRRPNRKVAIKLLHDAPTGDNADEFWHEADILAQVRHPGVAHVYAADATTDGRCYLVMELVEGQPITQHAASRQLGIRERVRLILQVCEAIDAVHRMGVVHRDLKPGNVLVDQAGRAKVVDFGVAVMSMPKEIAATPTDSTLVGTLGYMSPERLNDSAQSAIDARSDVYSIGVMLYELLTGRLPIDLRGVPLSSLPARVNEAKPPRVGKLVPACRGDLDAIIAKAIDKNPVRRYPAAVALAEDLSRYLGHRPVSARRSTPVSFSIKFMRRHRVATAVAAVAAVLVAATTVALKFAESSRRQAYLATVEAERTEQRRVARDNLYLSLIGLAADAEQIGQPTRAAALLNEAAARPAGEPELRGWEWHYLWRMTHPPFTSFQNAHVEARCVAVSPDGKLLASGGGNSGVNVYDLDNQSYQQRKPKFNLSGHRGLVTSVDFSPDGKRLLSTDASGRVQVWDAATGKALPSPPPLASNRSAGATYRPDGRYFAVSLNQDHLQIFDARDNALTLDLAVPGLFLSNQPAWSPDGKMLAASDSDGTTHIWHLGSNDAGEIFENAPPLLLPAMGGWKSAVTFHPSGKTIAASCGDGTVRLYDIATRSETLVLRGHNEWVTDVAFSPDGTWLASSSRDGTVRLWDTQTGTLLQTLSGHTAWVMGLAFDPAGRVVSAGFNSQIFRWNGYPPGMQPFQQQDLNDLAFGLVPCANDADGVRVIMKSGQVVRSSASPQQPAVVETPPSSTTQPGSDRAVFAIRTTGEQWVQAFSGESPQIIRKGASANARQSLLSITGPVLAAAFDPAGGSTLGIVTADAVALFDADDGRLLARVPSVDSPTAISFSPGVARVAISGTNLIVLRRTPDGFSPLASAPLAARSAAIAFSNDAKRIVSVGIDGRLVCLDGDTGSTLWAMNENPTDFTSVAFSPDGRRLLTGTGEGLVQVRDAASGRVLLTFKQSQQIRVMSLGWSASGTSVYAVNFMGQLFRWNAMPAEAESTSR